MDISKFIEELPKGPYWPTGAKLKNLFTAMRPALNLVAGDTSITITASETQTTIIANVSSTVKAVDFIENGAFVNYDVYTKRGPYAPE